jgi:hypothetical protein
MKKFNLLFAILFVFVIISCDNKSQSSETTATVENETNQDSVSSDSDTEETDSVETLEQYSQMNEEDREEAIEIEKAAEEETNQKTTTSAPKQASKSTLSSAEMQGAPVEFKVASYDLTQPSIVLTLLNRTDKAIKNIRAEITPVDAEGNSITSPTGREFSLPFNKSQNPQLVEAKSKAEVKLSSIGAMKRIPEDLKAKVSKLVVKVLEYQDVDGNTTKL